MFVIINRKKFYKFIVSLAVLTGLLLFGTKPVLRLFFPLQYKDHVQKYAAQHNVSPYLVYAIIKAESNFKNDVSSSKGAKGLMQITDETAQWCAGKMKLEKFDPAEIYNPEININIGSWYISYLLKDSGGSLVNALAAYNAGNGNVRQWLAEHGGQSIDPDKIPFPETRGYINKVIFNYKMYNALYN